MKGKILQDAEAELEEIRNANERTEQIRRIKIREEYPEIADLMNEREKLIRGYIHGILRKDCSAENITQKMSFLSSEIRKKLTESGLKENYLEPVYACPLCKDRGYVGEPVRTPCSCLKKLYQSKMRNAIGLRDDGSETFETFNETLLSDVPDPKLGYSQREVISLIRNKCERWADQWPKQKPQDLVLSGKSGLGKTFLLRAMAARLISRDVNVLLVGAYQFFETARKCYFGQEGYSLEDYLQADVLMIDDLGSEPMMQNITVEQLFNLISERRNRKLSTVFSTNLTLMELKERYTERIASRLSDRELSMFLEFIGQDIRNRKG